MAESKKTEKIDFRPWPKSKKQQKQRFGHGRKAKNDENCISATAETEEMPQNSFPTPWKWKKCLKTAFQPLGNGKNASKQLSNPLEMEEMPQNGFPTP